jgi:outer membrane biosynthesis protein TonB
MRDKSQIDDMRAALRGDLERARERRGATLLDRAPEPEPQAPDTQEPEPELRAEVSDTPIEAPEPPAPVSDTQQPAEIQEPEPKRRRFLWFLDG